jgi:Sulfatase-modifying factor enzyme 1
MEIVRDSLIDWEPLIVALAGKGLEADQVEQVTRKWLAERPAASMCICHEKSLHVAQDELGRGVVVACEWMCDSCLPSYFQRLEERFPNITQARIGSGFKPAAGRSEPARGGDSPYVDVPEKMVELEDGRRVVVPGFRIARWAVTTREFLEFVEATGYETSAQQQGLPETFLDYPGISPDIDERNQASVSSVSFDDATEYCRWKGRVRLPTEYEWMAASLVDERVYDEWAERELVRDHEGFLRQASLPNALGDPGGELTSTEEGGMVVVRFGPQWVRFTDWAEAPDENRCLIGKDESRFDVSFRTVFET